MRIGLIVPGGFHPSGTHDVIPALLSLTKRLAQKHEVTVIVTGQSRWPSHHRLLGADVFQLGTARRRLKGTHLAQSIALATAILLRARANIVHAFWAGHEGAVAGVIGRMLGIPVVLSIGGGELVAFDDIDYGGQRTLKSRLLVRSSIALAGTITAGSRAMIGLCPAHRPVRWLPLGTERDLFHSAMRRRSRTPFRILHVAGINRVKDPHTLLDAFARIVSRTRDVVLDWAGVDTLGGEIQRRAAALGLAAQVRFHGFVPQHALAAMYANADLYLHTSRHESQGVAIVEAAMSRLPIVSTRVGIAAELAPTAAIAVGIGDASALADAVIRLIDAPHLREELGLAAQRFALDHDADWTAAEFEKIYTELATRR
jgi:glycosyltransferase involved in cell wall biosynthesis